MDINNKLKGGEKKMEIKGIILVENCRYCGKEFRSLYKAQIENIIKSHEDYCKMNPSNKENVKNTN